MNVLEVLGIEVDYDKIKMGSQEMIRPSRISPSQWLKIWDLVSAIDANSSLTHGYLRERIRWNDDDCDE